MSEFKFGIRAGVVNTQCNALTRKGERCRRSVVLGEDLCQIHKKTIPAYVLDEFIKRGWNSEWVECGPMRVYLRRNPLITIANVSVSPPYRRQGHFTRFLNECESKFEKVYVEQVLNPQLREFLLERRGYLASSANPLCLSRSRV